MNKRLLIFMASLLLCGTLSAQQQPAYVHAHDNNMPVVAQVVLDGDALETGGYELQAYIGDDLRGSAQIQPTLDNTYWIQVYYSTEDEATATVSFKLYDGDDEYTAETTLTIDPEGVGTPGTPQVIEFATTQSQTIPLAAGWNWFSTNVDVSLSELQSALVQSLGTGNEITINSRSGEFSFYNGVRWRGDLTSLDITQMYQIETSAACEITLSGSRVNPTASQYQITITPGFNWISFLCNEEMDITTAFDNIAIAGDMVVSGSGLSSTFNGTRWRGDLSVLEPGKGYLYESASNETRTFNYPANNRGDISKFIANRFETHWPDFIPNAYPSNLPVVAVVQIDGSYITSEDNTDALEVAAFVDGECRGHKFMIDETSLGDPYPYVPLAVYYTSPEEPVSFILYNHETGVEYINCVSNIEILTGHKHNEYYLNPDNAVILNFTSPTPQPYTLEIPGYGTSEGGFHLIASPVTETITPSAENGFITDAFDLYYFDQKGDDEGKEWINYNPNQFNIESTKGYLYASESGTTLQFAGTAYNGDGVVPLEYFTTNPSTAMHGWNLIGNPFPNEASVDHDYYVMNEGGTELIAGSGHIAAMNGLFVKATEEGQSVTFTPNASNGSDGMIILNMLRDRGAAIDRAIVRLNGNSTLPKFMLNPNNTKIYIEQDGDDYAVVSSTANEMPVSFKAASNGTYTLNVAVVNTEMGYLHLIDHIAGTDTDLLTNPSYTFEANTNDYASRFTLVMVTSVGLEEHFAFYNGHNWSISNNGEALLQVVDVMGRVLNSKEISGDVEININQPAGVYMFRLINGNDVKVQKVIIK